MLFNQPTTFTSLHFFQFSVDRRVYKKKQYIYCSKFRLPLATTKKKTNQQKNCRETNKIRLFDILQYFCQNANKHETNSTNIPSE